MNRPALNENEREARQQLVAFAMAMMNQELSFFEGAPKILSLKDNVGGVPDRDQDFDVFVVISSETDHLPLQAQRSLWSSIALDNLASEFKKTELWARKFAPEACKNLIERFSENS